MSDQYSLDKAWYLQNKFTIINKDGTMSTISLHPPRPCYTYYTRLPTDNTVPKVTTVEVNAVQNVNFRYDQYTRSKIIATQIAKFRYEQDTQARVIATQIANFISSLDTNTKVEFDKKIANAFTRKTKALKAVAPRSRP